MQSAHTLKHSISVNPSLYAAVLVFSLYGLVIILLLLIFKISWLTSPLFVLLLFIAAYGARKSYLQRYQLKISDSGRVEFLVDGIFISGVVSASSFYNALFISLSLEDNPDDFIVPNKHSKYTAVIYRDAISEPEYRLLARVINFGQA